MSKSKNMRGFTLVELLVVMAILSVLIALSIAGLGYAMRRSRNIARQAAVENMVVGLEAYYTDHQKYPLHATAGGLGAIFGPTAGSFLLQPYIENTWDAPPASEFYYKDDGKSDPQLYTICVNQEIWNDATSYDWICQGTGVGASSFPVRKPATLATCTGCAGTSETWDGTAWSYVAPEE